MYRELSVRPSLVGVVGAVWVRDGAAAGTSRVLPDGCTDLIWVDGAMLVAGPDTRAHLAAVASGSSYVAVRFAPGAGPAVLGVPADELRDGRVPLADLWPARRARLVADHVAAAPDRPAALQAVVADRLSGAGAPDPVTAAIAAGQRAGRSVAATARALGLSPRQVHRRSLSVFGYGPKTLARILRFQGALALARAGTPLAEVAVRTGYADQAHLAREVRALAGVPLGTLIR